MSQTLAALNEKLTRQILEVKGPLLSKENIMKFGFILIFSTLALTINYKIGAVFMLPLLCSIIQLKRKLSYFLLFSITVISLIINIMLSISVVIAFLPLIVLIHNENSRILNNTIIILISLMSYFVNISLNLVEFNLLHCFFIFFYNLGFYNIYSKVIDIKKYNKNKKDFLFKEEILASLALLINLLFGLFVLNIFDVSIGYIMTILTIMILGSITSKVNTIGYTLIVYLIMQYYNLSIIGVEMIPFIGLISAYISSNRTVLKTLCFYLLIPVMFYFGIVNGDVITIFGCLGIATTLYYIINPYIYNKYRNLLIPKYEEAKYYQIYVENFREDISQRLLNFAELFDAFANKSVETNNELIKVDEAIDEIIDKHCKNCLKKELCLNTNHIKTYNYLSQLVKEGDKILNNDKKRFVDLFGMFCLNAYDIINTSIELNKDYMIKGKTGTNILFQSQLHGLSKILQNFAVEVNNDYENETIKIEKLRDKMKMLGFDIAYMKVNNIKIKNLDIDIGLRNYQKENNNLIKNLVEEIVKEDVDIIEINNGKLSKKLKIVSKQIYDLDFGTSYIGKDGSRISGDNFLKCEMHNGNTVVALSDGMGNGYAAHVESKSTLELLNKMLHTGADDHTAVSIINTLVSLKEYNERFSTLDYITVNKSLGIIDFYKIGSAPSFIIRGNKVIRINNDNLPVGVTNEKIDKISFDLETNDIVIIVSDGVVERFNNINKFEKLLIELIKTSTIQFAHDIIRAAIAEFGGKIIDDMTAIVIKVNNKKFKLSA